MIDEQPRQIKQRGEPGHHEDDVQGLDPEHGGLFEQTAARQRECEIKADDCIGGQHAQMQPPAGGHRVVHQRPHQFDRMRQRQQRGRKVHGGGQLLGREEHAAHQHHRRDDQRHVVDEEIVTGRERRHDQAKAAEGKAGDENDRDHPQRQRRSAKAQHGGDQQHGAQLETDMAAGARPEAGHVERLMPPPAAADRSAHNSNQQLN